MDQVYEILIHKVHDYEGTINEMTGSIFTMTMDRINRELSVLITNTAEAISSEMSW